LKPIYFNKEVFALFAGAALKLATGEYTPIYWKNQRSKIYSHSQDIKRAIQK
jgi:hypothetical protein